MAKFSAYMRGEKGTAAGIGQPKVSSVSISHTTSATVSISTYGPNDAKTFDFNFGIPVGVPADFDEPTATAIPIASNLLPDVTITTSGPATKKKFDFEFKIPAANNAAGYKYIEFTTDVGTGYIWNGTILKISRTAEMYAPIAIYKKDNSNNNYITVAGDFIIDDSYISYQTDEKFSGRVYCVSIG